MNCLTYRTQYTLFRMTENRQHPGLHLGVKKAGSHLQNHSTTMQVLCSVTLPFPVEYATPETYTHCAVNPRASVPETLATSTVS